MFKNIHVALLKAASSSDFKIAQTNGQNTAVQNKQGTRVLRLGNKWDIMIDPQHASIIINLLHKLGRRVDKSNLITL